MKILVTGGCGFIGSNIVARLSKMGCDVVVLDNLFVGSKKNIEGLNVEFVQESIMDYEKLCQLMRGADYVFHQAAFSSSPMFLEGQHKEGINVNINGFMNVMDAALKNNVKKVIFASTSSMYSGNPLPYSEGQEIKTSTFYEAGFRCRELLAHTYWKMFGMQSVGLRYFSVYGPRERAKGNYANNISQFIWDMLANRRPVIYGDGTQTRDFTFVEDIVDANILAMKSDVKCDVFNVGTGIATSFNTLLMVINKVLGTEIKPQYVPNPIKNYVQNTVADISKIKNTLGFEPNWPLERGIEFTAEYYKNVKNP
jgi:UDP-glucose 4-epimerase